MTEQDRTGHDRTRQDMPGQDGTGHDDFDLFLDRLCSLVLCMLVWSSHRADTEEVVPTAHSWQYYTIDITGADMFSCGAHCLSSCFGGSANKGSQNI